MSKVYKSLAFSMSSKYLTRAINLASIVVVSRILTPAEIGVFAIASALILVASELKMFGASNYLIRKEEVTDSDVRNALGVSFLISWGLGAILFIASWSLEQFYGKTDIASLIQILTLGFFLSPHVGVGRALLQRDFKFKQVFWVETLSVSFYFVSVISLVYLDFSYFALAVANALKAVVEMLLVCIVFKHPNLRLLPAVDQFRKVFKVGFYVSFANVLRQVTISVPDLIIGKLGTSAQVAYFSRGMGLLNFLTMTINAGIQPVIAPLLADKKRTGQDVSTTFLKSSQLLCAITIPMLAVAGYSGTQVIVFFFGSQWYESGPVVSILCIWAILRFLHIGHRPLFITGEREKVLFYKELVIFLVTCLAVYSAFSGGLNNIAWSLVGSAALALVVTAFMLRHYFGLGIRKQVLNQLPNLIVTVACLTATYLTDLVVNFSLVPPWWVVTLLALVNFMVWCLAIVAIGHPLATEVKRVLVLIMGRVRARK